MINYTQLSITAIILMIAMFMIPHAIDKQYSNNDKLKIEYKYK